MRRPPPDEERAGPLEWLVGGLFLVCLYLIAAGIWEASLRW